MTVSPPRRRSRIVFWIAAIVILSAIAATALLANDKRNLRAIAAHYHIAWLDFAPTVAPRQPPLAKRGVRPIAVSPAMGKPVSPRLVDGVESAPGTFLRRWKISGETVCSRIAQAGVAVGQWHQGDLDSSTFECSYQTPVTDTDTSEQPSLFVIVRGMPNGDIANVRIKAILPDNPAGNELKRKFQGLVEVLVQQTQWRDFDAAADQIDKLQNVTQSVFGARLVFSHEFANPRRFNLILDLDKPTKAQSATAAFFDTSKHFPIPDNTGEK
jgi:hypothetical protein